MRLKTFDIALVGNPDLTGVVPFSDYIDALVTAADSVSEGAISPTERNAFDRFVEVVRNNASATISNGKLWRQLQSANWSRDKLWWLRHFSFSQNPYIFQPPVKGLSSSLAIVQESDETPDLRLVAKDVGNFLSKEAVVRLLETARKKANHILVEHDGAGEWVPIAIDALADTQWPGEGDETYGFPSDFIATGSLQKKLNQDTRQFPEGFLSSLKEEHFGGFEELTSAELATVRTFFSKLRRALKSKSESSGSQVINIRGDVVDITETADELTEIVATSINTYLEMNWFQLLNPLTISLGGDDADVNVEVDTSADLRTQVRSALEQISAPLARELEYSVFGFDSDTFEVAGELMYFAGFN